MKKAAQILSPEMLRSFEGFEYSSTPNGILRFRLKAKRLVDRREGKSYIEGIEAYDFNPDGTTRNAIHSVNAVFDREHNSAEFFGDVRVFLGDEFELQTDRLHYDLKARRGETPDRIRVISKMASGTAKGVYFDQGQKTLELKSDVDFVLTAGGSGAGEITQSRQFHASANRAFCTDEMRRLIFQGRARVDSGPDELSADSIESVLSPDRRRVVSLVSAGRAAYSSKRAGESQLLRGDRMVFAIGKFQSLEKVNVTGQAMFSSDSPAETQTLSGREIELFFNGATSNPLRIEGRGNVLFKRKGPKERIQVSGNVFIAAFSPASKSLQSVSVREQAAMSIEDAQSSTHNELKSREILLSFHDVEGRMAFEKLRAAGDARWTYRQEPKGGDIRREPARVLEASSLEMVFSREGNSFESGSASGNVAISEARTGAGDEAQLSRLLADFAEFQFFPGNNRLRNMSARGHVRADYEKPQASKENRTAEKFNTTSDNMETVFSLRDGKSALESAAQWGNFVYKDASMTATAGRCEYDATKGILTLRESPGISDAMSSTSGERMEYELKQRTVSVYGRVRSRLNTKGTEGQFLGFSSSSSPVIVTSDEMRYWTAERHARYGGKVQALSESGQLDAARLDIIDGGDQFEAQGAVRHYIPRRESPENGARADKVLEKRIVSGTEMTIRSSTLKYEKQTNKITYAGGVVVRSGELHLSSDTLVASVTEKGGGLERATARGKVRIRQNSKEGKADVADYFFNDQKFILTGNPAEIDEPGKVRSTAPQLTYFMADDRILFGSQ